MAYCSECQHYISYKDIMTKELVCEECHTALRFNSPDYKNVTRPGFYIAIFLMMNVYMLDHSPLQPLISLLLVILWFIFFRRFIKFIHEARLEVKDE